MRTQYFTTTAKWNKKPGRSVKRLTAVESKGRFDLTIYYHGTMPKKISTGWCQVKTRHFLPTPSFPIPFHTVQWRLRGSLAHWLRSTDTCCRKRQLQCFHKSPFEAVGFFFGLNLCVCVPPRSLPFETVLVSPFMVLFNHSNAPTRSTQASLPAWVPEDRLPCSAFI